MKRNQPYNQTHSTNWSDLSKAIRSCAEKKCGKLNAHKTIKRFTSEKKKKKTYFQFNSFCYFGWFHRIIVLSTLYRYKFSIIEAKGFRIWAVRLCGFIRLQWRFIVSSNTIPIIFRYTFRMCSIRIPVNRYEMSAEVQCVFSIITWTSVAKMIELQQLSPSSIGIETRLDKNKSK